LKAVISLVKDGLLKAEVAAIKLNMSLDEFTKLLDESVE